MSGAGHPASTQPVGKGGPQTPKAQSDDSQSSVNATPPPPAPPDLFSDGVAAGGAAGSGSPGGAAEPQSTHTSPAVLEETGGTDDEQDDDPEEGAWLGPDDDDAECGWDEQNKAIDDKTIAFNKAIPVDLLDWDMQMQLGQIRARDPRIWKEHQESFAMTPPGAPVSVLVKATHSMSCLPRVRWTSVPLHCIK